MNLTSLITQRLRQRAGTLDGPIGSRRWSRLTPDDLRRPRPLYITASALRAVRHSVGTRPAESGGVLGGANKDGVARHFHFDRQGEASSVTYSPDVQAINQLLKSSWRESECALLGFVHSHPRGNTRPSGGDLAYADRILDARPSLRRLLIPIVQTIPDTGAFNLHGAVAHRDLGRTTVDQVPVTVIPDLGHGAAPDDSSWDRVRNAYDLAAMSTTRLVVVGCGGSSAFIEDMVRCGLGEVVLIDPDVIERPNLATQQVYRSDLGRPKVEAIAERLLDVSRHVRVATLKVSLDDLTDADIDRLARDPLPESRIGGPGLTILCGFTDDFWAQARVNRLALQLGVAQLQAGVYREGRGLELFYAVPGCSVACARCVLRPRYDQYLQHAFVNDVTSRGTPLVATARLNQIKSDATLAIVHAMAPNADPTHPATRRWSAAFEYIGRRNFVQVGLDPFGDEQLGMTLFGNVRSLDPDDRLGFDQTVWHAKPARRDCPDCGGHGASGPPLRSFDRTDLERPKSANRSDRTAKRAPAAHEGRRARPCRTGAA